jgi:glycerol-3-phosphate dehydrogenase
MTQTESYDVLVIGGGINGAGIARDAAGRGLAVAICDQGDFAGATSSASTKLIHGGLRYLEYFEFRLVAESLREREHLLAIAPHITKPLRFVMPHVVGLRPRWMIRLGLWLYDHIGGRISLPHSQSIKLKKLSTINPLRSSIENGFTYSDAWVDDARLVILNLRSAQAYGAAVYARTRLISAMRVGGRWECVLENVASKETKKVEARTLVNAAGPWVAQMDQIINPSSHAGHRQAAVKLVRGSHIIVPKLYTHDHAYILQNPDKRIVFMIPYEESFTLIGTTDVPQDHMDNATTISEEETSYLIDAVNGYLDKPITRNDIVWSYSGVRPLFDDEADNPSAVTRDYTLVLQDAMNVPCLSVYGGKITTYRRLAEAALDELRPWLSTLSQRSAWTKNEALPGGEFKRAHRASELQRLYRRYPEIEKAYLEKLFSRHGLTAYIILKDAQRFEDLGRHFGAGLTAREVEYLAIYEWAHRAEDILWRRTKCGLHMTKEEQIAFSAYFAEHHYTQ